MEICWNFPLSKEKYRMLCSSIVISRDSKDLPEALNGVFEKVWEQQSDDDKMTYRAALSGNPKSMAAKTDMNSYEPEQEDAVPANFMACVFIPERIDQTIYAPPNVVADSRRKPQQYESIAQPFKKDRRFLFTVKESAEWEIKEINP